MERRSLGRFLVDRLGERDGRRPLLRGDRLGRRRLDPLPLRDLRPHRGRSDLGRVGRCGVLRLAASLDHVGPMTRSAADAAAMLGVIAGAGRWRRARLRPRMLRFAAPFDASGSPTITLPNGFDAAGMLLSFQLAGRHPSERLLCRAGHALRSGTDRHTRRPPALP